MAGVRTFRGRGEVVSGEHKASVVYSLSVRESNGNMTTTGTLQGDLLAMAMSTGGLPTLHLEDGQTVQIFLSNASSNGTATFKTSGPLPKF